MHMLDMQDKEHAYADMCVNHRPVIIETDVPTQLLKLRKAVNLRRVGAYQLFWASSRQVGKDNRLGHSDPMSAPALLSPSS